ncbi:MAG: DMT family transporter [Deltaproteobacteria bacterium]|jgi:drug/metabolite transporter (DMT)-like permease|nr:DMT family transporter [Deltaproteobacteria bacterium]
MMVDKKAPLIAALVVVDSVHFVFARLLLPHISPDVSVFYVMAVGTVQVGLYGVFCKRIQFKTLYKNVWFFLSIAVLIGVSTIINYEAVAFVDAGTASVLGKASILMSVGLGIFWLRERFTRFQSLGALLALTGVLVITFQPGEYIRLGSLLILLSAFMYALHTAIVKRYGEEIDFLEFFFFRLFATSAVLFLIAVGRRALVWPDPLAWGLLVMTGTIDVVISRALFYFVLRRMTMSIHSIVLTLSPVAAIVLAFLLFDTMPTFQQLIGGAGVIIGVFMVTLKRRG